MAVICPICFVRLVGKQTDCSVHPQIMPMFRLFQVSQDVEVKMARYKQEVQDSQQAGIQFAEMR